MALGAKLFQLLINVVTPYTPSFLNKTLQLLTYSFPVKINIVTIILFILGFFTVYRFIDRKLLQKLGKTIIFKDDFDSDQGWLLNYWGSNNPNKTCRFEDSSMVFEADETALMDDRKEYGAYYDLTSGIYEGSKYEISCWVKSEEKTSMGFKLWVHDTRNQNGIKFPARFYTPGSDLEEIKVGFTATSSQALRIHLHNKAGTGKIIVDKVLVTKVK